MKDNLWRLYKDKQGNRDLIISQVLTLIKETTPFWILKTDIKQFYESIDRKELLNIIENNKILSFYSNRVLEILFSHRHIKNQSGLPRGISVSPILSEIYMRKFDKWIKSQDGVYFYARYVDDIIIFTYDEISIKKITSIIESKLGSNLKLNKEKTDVYNGKYIREKNPLNYLGYSISCKQSKKNKNVKITIALKKVNKIKTRIVKSVLAFIKDSNLNLLKDRIKFLTGNYSVKRQLEGTSLKAGIYYNYKYIEDLKVLEELDIFLRKILFCNRGKLGRVLKTKTTQTDLLYLSKFSFKFGYQNKVHVTFSPNRILEITSCWK